MSLLERSSDEGNFVGRDPRKVTAAEYEEAGIDRIVGMKAIRLKCLDCCCQNAAEVRKCVSTDCVLWPLRMGSKPADWR